MATRSLLKQAIASMAESNILASCSYLSDPLIADAYRNNDRFQEHVKWDMAHRLTELIFERMDYRVDHDHPSGGTCYTASIRAFNQKQWEDLERQLDDKAAYNQIVVLNTHDH
jgi:hypothetical protein